MNKILKLSAIALLASSTSLMAQMTKTGPYIGAGIGIAGATAEGTFTDSNNARSSGTVGKVGALPQLEIGYQATSNLSFGLTYTPLKAKFDATSDSGDVTNAKVELKDIYTVYVQPSLSLGSNSEVFAKLGYTRSKLSGSNITGLSNNVNGKLFAIGNRSYVNNNTYIQIEASYSDYSSISGTNIGGTNSATADPKIAAGLVSVGYKF